jgi:hypothetical protein
MPRSKIWTLLGLAGCLIGGQTNAQPAVSGRDATVVATPTATFTLGLNGRWIEVERGRGQVMLQETRRDEGSVYLADAVHGVTLQLDLAHGQVLGADRIHQQLRPLGTIIRSSREVTANNVKSLTDGNLEFIGDRRGWSMSARNTDVFYQYREVRRDRGSIYLAGIGPTANERVQLNLAEGLILRAQAPRDPLQPTQCPITRAYATDPDHWVDVRSALPACPPPTDMVDPFQPVTTYVTIVRTPGHTLSMRALRHWSDVSDDGGTVSLEEVSRNSSVVNLSDSGGGLEVAIVGSGSVIYRPAAGPEVSLGFILSSGEVNLANVTGANSAAEQYVETTEGIWTRTRAPDPAATLRELYRRNGVIGLQSPDGAITELDIVRGTIATAERPGRRPVIASCPISAISAIPGQTVPVVSSLPACHAAEPPHR